MPNNYEKLAHIYIRLVRGYSPAASAELEKIRTFYGARAAYFAAIGIALLIHKMKRQRWNGPDEYSTSQLAEIPEVVPLYLKAVEGLSSDMQEKPSQV